MQVPLGSAALDALIPQRISGPMQFLDGDTFVGLTHLNRIVRRALEDEKEVRNASDVALITTCTRPHTVPPLSICA